MKIYKFEKYYISKGIEFQGDYIIDNRIKEKYKILDKNDVELIENIFNKNCVLDLIDSPNIDRDKLKEMLINLSNADIIVFKNIFKRKNVYDVNISVLLLKLASLLIIKNVYFFIPIYFCMGILDSSFINTTSYLLIFIFILIFHELCHMISYILLLKNRDYFFSVYNFDVQLVTKSINCKEKIVISSSGPLITGIICFIVYIRINNIFFLIMSIYNIIMLLPFFDDGKNIKDSIVELINN